MEGERDGVHTDYEGEEGAGGKGKRGYARGRTRGDRKGSSEEVTWQGERRRRKVGGSTDVER